MVMVWCNEVIVLCVFELIELVMCNRLIVRFGCGFRVILSLVVLVLFSSRFMSFINVNCEWLSL